MPANTVLHFFEAPFSEPAPGYAVVRHVWRSAYSFHLSMHCCMCFSAPSIAARLFSVYRQFFFAPHLFLKIGPPALDNFFENMDGLFQSLMKGSTHQQPLWTRQAAAWKKQLGVAASKKPPDGIQKKRAWMQPEFQFLKDCKSCFSFNRIRE